MLAKKIELGGETVRIAFAAYGALDAKAVEPLLEYDAEARVVDTRTGRQIGRWVLVWLVVGEEDRRRAGTDVIDRGCVLEQSRRHRVAPGAHEFVRDLVRNAAYRRLFWYD